MSKDHLKIAIVCNMKTLPKGTVVEGKACDFEAEFDAPGTVQKYVEFFEKLGHEATIFQGNMELLQFLSQDAGKNVDGGAYSAPTHFPFDICWNVAEGFRGLDRESQIPAIMEFCNIPYTFGSPLCMALTLDKAMTKRVLAYHGLPTPAFQEFSDPEAPLDKHLEGRFPLFVKPNAEGTGMGITSRSFVRNEAELRAMLHELLDTYGHTVLVEEFVPGRDVTCGAVGNFAPFGKGVHITPINEVDYVQTNLPEQFEGYDKTNADGQLFYCSEIKQLTGSDFHAICPAKLPENVTKEIQRLTAEVFRVVGGRDAGRVDFRLDNRECSGPDDMEHLRPVILEINPIPGMMFESDLTVCAAGEGKSHFELIANVLAAACERYGIKNHNVTDIWEPNHF